MGGITTLTWSGIRRRWRSLVVVAVLVGLGGGAATAAVAASRRTLSALPRFEGRVGPLDATVNAPDVTLGADDPTLAAVRALPSVAAAYRFSNVLAEGKDASDPRGHSRQLPDLAVDDGALFGFGTPYVVAGRLAHQDAADEVMLGEEAARVLGLRVGDRWHLALFTIEQFSDAGTGADAVPAGPAVDLKVVGIARFPFDLGRSYGQKNIYGGTVHAYLTPAFSRRYAIGMASYGVLIGARLRHGAAGFAQFNRELGAALQNSAFAQRTADDSSLTAVLPAVRVASRLQSSALVVLAALIALATLLLGGQAVARDATAQVSDAPVLRSMGLTEGRITAAVLFRSALAAVLAAALAVALAVAASPLAPIGVARRAELHPGVEVNQAVLALGALAVVATIMVRALLAARRVLRVRPERAGRPGLAGGVAAALPPTAAIGVRFALGADRRYVGALRAVVFTVTIGVAGATAALVLTDSLHALVDRPGRWGAQWDVAVGGFALPEEYAAGVARLDASRDVAAHLGLATGDAMVKGHNVEIVAFDGESRDLRAPLLEGTFPVDGEVALGRLTAERLGAHIGDDIALVLEAGADPVRVKVSGIALMNATLMDARIEPGVGVLSPISLARSVNGQAVPQVLLVRLRRGVDRTAALARFERAFPHTVQTPVVPNNIHNLVELQPLLLVLVGLVGVLALGTLAHGLTVLLRRRRRDLAVLRALGLLPRQVAATVASSALTLVLVGLTLGVPLGLGLGRWGWRLVNRSIGLDGNASLPVVALATLVAGVLALVLALAAVPGVRAARQRPAGLLRTE